MQYDDEGNLTWKQGPDGQEASDSYAYNAGGRLISQTDLSGRSQRDEYDEQGRLWKSIDGSTAMPMTRRDRRFR